MVKFLQQEAILRKVISDEEAYKLIEHAGRTAYKSVGKGENSHEAFISMIIKKNHGSVLEHVSLTFDIVTDRGIAQELLRHRHLSAVMESTRYCNYSNDKFEHQIGVVEISDELIDDGDRVALAARRDIINSLAKFSEECYMRLLKLNVRPEIARDVLPLSLAARITVTANIREWRYIYSLRSTKFAHPQMVELINLIGKELIDNYPLFFKDIYNPEQ